MVIKTKCTIDAERVRREIEELTLFDDFFMRKFFHNAKAETELVLRILLNNTGIRVKHVEDIHLKDVNTETVLKNLYEHEAQLDILAADENGRSFNIEFQVDPRHAEFRRARFYAGMIDSSSLKRGEPYTSLPDVYIIFLTLGDVVGYGHDIDVFSVINHQNHEKADFGMYYIYVNCLALSGDTELDKLKHDFMCKDPDKMNFPELGRRMKFIKSKTAEDSEMNSILERFKAEGWEEGREEGLIEGQEKGILSQRFATILRMIDDGCDDIHITKYTDATSDEIEAARQQLNRQSQHSC